MLSAALKVDLKGVQWVDKMAASMDVSRVVEMDRMKGLMKVAMKAVRMAASMALSMVEQKVDSMVE